MATSDTAFDLIMTRVSGIERITILRTIDLALVSRIHAALLERDDYSLRLCRVLLQRRAAYTASNPVPTTHPAQRR